MEVKDKAKLLHCTTSSAASDKMSSKWRRFPFSVWLSALPHDDVIKNQHFPRYWPFVRGIHRSPVNSPHKGQWCEALMFSLICAWNNNWANNGDTGDLRRHRAHYDVILMLLWMTTFCYVIHSNYELWWKFIKYVVISDICICIGVHANRL